MLYLLAPKSSKIDPLLKLKDGQKSCWIRTDGSRVYQQMALPVESQTVIIAINEILFKTRTEGIKIFILCYYGRSV